MITTRPLLACLLLAAQTAACSSTAPAAASRPIATVSPMAASSDGPVSSPSVEPTSPATPTADGLVVSVVGSRRVRFDPRLADADIRDGIDALWSPEVVDFAPRAAGSPFDALMSRVLARYPDGMPAQLHPDDVADIARTIPGMARRDQEREDAARRYRAHFGDQPRALFVDPPTVDLALRIANPADEPIHLKVSGDAVTRRMRLVGPGAKHALGGGDPTEIYMCGAWVTVAPHGHHDIPVTRLAYGHRAAELGAYWTEPGAYVLQMSLETTVATGAQPPDGCGGGTHTELVAAAIALEVR